MKICVPTMGEGGMDELVCQHFGRAPTFTMIDLDSGEVRLIPNVSEHMGGTGLPTEAILAEGVHVMIAGGLGPKAISLFGRAGVDVFVGATGTVREAIDDWLSENLTRADPANACKEHKH